MKRLLFPLVIAAAAMATWWVQSLTTRQLTSEVIALRAQSATMAALRAERQRLAHLLPSTDELTALRAQSAAAAVPAPETTTRSTEPVLRVGEWAAAKTWTNRGQASAAATMETALYAAAGGDTELLSRLLDCSDEVRTRLERIREALPDVQRALYPTAESLLSAFAAKSIPVGEAQLVWYHESDDENAVACLFVRNPLTTSGAVNLTPET